MRRSFAREDRWKVELPKPTIDDAGYVSLIRSRKTGPRSCSTIPHEALNFGFERRKSDRQYAHLTASFCLPLRSSREGCCACCCLDYRPCDRHACRHPYEPNHLVQERALQRCAWLAPSSFEDCCGTSRIRYSSLGKVVKDTNVAFITSRARTRKWGSWMTTNSRKVRRKSRDYHDSCGSREIGDVHLSRTTCSTTF